MGNICSSRSSIATQTGSARKKRPVISPKIEKEAKTVQRRTWDDVFDHVKRAVLWEGVPRASRSEWKPYLAKIEELSNLPKKTLDETKLKALLQGRETGNNLPYNNKILLYVCSTGTDTQVERTVLIKDVYPFVRDISRQFGLEFEVVDLKWGRSNTSSQDKYPDVQIHLNELKRFLKAEEASLFLCFVSDNYGERLLPLEIEEETLDTITAYMINNNIDTTLIKQAYILDKNSIRRKYVLRTTSDGCPQLSDTDRHTLLKLMKDTIPECFPYGPEMISKYFASLYEYELTSGLQSKGGKIFIKKTVNDTDISDGTYKRKLEHHNETNDEYDLKQLKTLNERVEESVCESKDSLFQLKYNEMHEVTANENAMQLADYVCENLLNCIAKYHLNSVSVINDYVLQDIVIHDKHSNAILHNYQDRNDEIEMVRKYLQDDCIKVPLVVHGVQGIGKSAFMVTAANLTRLPHHVQVLRHIGLTPESTHVKDLLTSVCNQLERAYNRNVINVTGSYAELISRFRKCLSFATESDPIILYLLSLNNLSSENFARNLRWLQLEKELPPFVKIIVSTSGEILASLRQMLQSNQLIEIGPTLPMEVSNIILMKLAEAGRQITFDQTQTLVSLYQRSTFSLFCGFGLNIATKWHSYDTFTSDNIQNDLLEMTEKQLIDLEERSGPIFVHRTIGYLAASKHGLSSIELVDLLSCDDEVLDAVLDLHVSPIRRFPSIYMIKLLQELSPFLTETVYRGVHVFTWNNREIADMMKGRYLVNPFRNGQEAFEKKARTDIADYFENKWFNGKVYSNLSSVTAGEKFGRLEPRFLTSQPVVISGNIQPERKLNSRRLTELPYQLIHLKEWNRFQAIYKLEFIEAKFKDGLGFECFRDLTEAARLSGKRDITYLTRLVASNMSVLWKEPFAVYQIASQYPATSSIYKLLKASEARSFPLQFVSNVSVLKEDTNCELTLHGHTAGVRSCDLSPAGDMIVSAANDGSMNIWYVITGMELAAMTSLPLPVDGNENDRLPSIPCCFSRSGDRIVVGTEDGNVLQLDNSGTMIKQENTDIDNITCIKFSLDGKTLVTSFKGGQLYFWDLATLEHQSTIQLEETIFGLDLSPDGNILAIACSKGLVLVDMINLVILSASVDTLAVGNLDQEIPDWFAICCDFHPSGQQVFVGSSDNSIGIWDVSEGKIRDKIVGHYGWVTSIKLNKDGDRMYSGSADRTIRAWSYDTKWTCIATLIGHSDVITMLTLDPTNGVYLVSSSLDCSLKVWNVGAIKIEEEVNEKDDGFEEGSDVMDQDSDADTTEFIPFSTLTISHTTGTIVYSKDADRYCRIRRPGYPTVNTTVFQGVVEQTAFTADGSKVVVLDSGRKKSDIYKENHPRRVRSGPTQTRLYSQRRWLETARPYISNVSICSVETGKIDHVIDAAGFADDERPTSFACGAWFIAIGTNKGDIYIYDDKAYEKLQQISWHDVITTMASCTVKNYVIAGSHKQAIILKISLDGYETVAYLPETEFDCKQCAFSPVGNTLVSGLENGEIHVWKISETEITLVATKTEHSSRIKDIAFSRSGDVMVTCGDRSMRVWDMINGVALKCTYYNTIERVVCIEEDVVLAGDFSGKLNTLTW